MPATDPAILKSVKVKVQLPFLQIESEWVATPAERGAAWCLYVEVITRVVVQPLPVDHGLLRESLTSLHDLFRITREILRAGGPGLGASQESIGGIAITLLNRRIRPFLAKWHPLLATWEAERPPRISAWAHEQKWTGAEKLRAELKSLQQDVLLYAHALARIAGVEQ
ncbi:MAG: hypothetical protein HZA54_18160 [Planctomycetes bacterium]|nr:hypothetical protein [Planctomycetota bacterium]